MKQKNQKILYLLCGAPGSGKSTWAKENSLLNRIVISRDKIRFSILEDDDNYFDHETEVFNKFIEEINTALSMISIDSVIVDATHLSEAARNKVLNRLNLDNVMIIAVSFEVSLDTCLERNENRTGRSYVPRSSLRRMHCGFTVPTFNEKYKYNTIIHVNEDGHIDKVERNEV